MFVEPIAKRTSRAAQPPTTPMLDLFADPRSPGDVIGSRSTNGQVRHGVDRDRLISIDHGALRIGHVRRMGWGRQGVSYGPYERADGLAFSALVLNGHNGSQTRVDYVRTPRSQLRHVGLGLLRHAIDLLPRRWIPKALDAWVLKVLSHHHWPKISENLRVGWYPQRTSKTLTDSENEFVVTACGVNNGDLCARVGQRLLPVVPGIQNVPYLYVTVLRERGAAHYICGPDKVRGVAAYPNLRPLAIDTVEKGTTVFAGFSQAVSGEVGWHIDTRVFGAQVAQVPRWSSWYGSAHGADMLTGRGALDGSSAQKGGVWSNWRGGFLRSMAGVSSQHSESVAILHGKPATGLVHAVFEPSREGGSAGLVWRAQDEANYWAFVLSADGCRLICVIDGNEEVVALSDAARMLTGEQHALQVIDDGCLITAAVDGAAVFERAIEDGRLGDAPAFGLIASGSADAGYFSRFEAHPRMIPLPSALDLGPSWQAAGTRLRAADSFSGPVADLEGKPTAVGGKTWGRVFGPGVFVLTGCGGVRVDADAGRPNPGRTAYAIDWDDPDLADVEVEMIPPGTGPGQREMPRGGLVFWQDPDNYLLVSDYIEDSHVGKSVSSFFRRDGKEDLYEAVWSCVGNRIHWGVPHRFRIVFDGNRYAVHLNDELVLYRALTDVNSTAVPLKIRKIGLLANWEFGDDTGTIFQSFTARA
jgi:hypothetical protein